MSAELKILVVDDSKIMGNTIKGIFTESESCCIFFEARDGEDALSQLEMSPVDLVFFDWNVPKQSGINFLKQIRAIEKYKTLPIIIVISESAKFNVIEALKSGATDYITKPIKTDLLKAKLVKLNLG